MPRTERRQAGEAREPLRRRLARLYGLDEARTYGATVWTLAAGTVVSYVGRGAAIPFAALYLTTHAGVPLAMIGLGVLLEQVVRAMLSPLFGGLSDRYGRKPFMVLGLVLQALTIPSYLLVQGPASYLLVSVLAGLGQAPYQPTLSAFLSDVTPKEKRVGVFGLVHMTKNLGFSLGVALGALLLAHSYALLFVAGGVLPLLYALAIVLRVREPVHAASAKKVHPLRAATSAIGDVRFLGFLGASMVLFLAWGQLDTVLPVYVADALGFGGSWVSIVFLVNSALVVLFQVPVSHHVERWPKARGIALACAVTGFSYLVLAALALLVLHGEPGLARWGLLGATLVFTASEMMGTPLLFALAADMAPKGMTGGAMGVLALAAPLGMGSAPFLAGLLSAALGWAYVWAAFALVQAVGIGAFLLLGRAARAEPALAAAPAPG